MNKTRERPMSEWVKSSGNIFEDLGFDSSISSRTHPYRYTVTNVGFWKRDRFLYFARGRAFPRGP